MPVSQDTNDVADIFLHTGTTTRVSLDINDGQGDGPSYNPVISNDGSLVAFESHAALDAQDFNGLPDIYVRKVTAPVQTFRASVSAAGVEGNGESLKPVITGDGRYILFESFASNLVNGDTNNAWDIFVRDRGIGGTAYPLNAIKASTK